MDDEPDIQKIIVSILEDKGIETLVAENGEDALEIYKQNPSSIDLIISDLKMPKMDGPTLFNEIVAMNPTNRPKFIAITGCVLTDFHKAISTDIDGYFYKPFEDHNVLETIKNVFRKSG